MTNVNRARAWAVGEIGFGADADLETVSEVVSTFVRAFVPPEGLRVRAARGARSEVLPGRFSATSSISAKQLARGGSVELTAGDFQKGAPEKPLFWVDSRPGAEVVDELPVRIGFCMPRPASARGEEAVATAMNAVAEAAADVPGCISIFVTAQERALSLATAATEPSEPAAAWRLLVPKGRVRGLSRPPPDGLTLKPVASGLLVCVDAKTPFVMGDLATLERWLTAKKKTTSKA